MNEEIIIVISCLVIGLICMLIGFKLGFDVGYEAHKDIKELIDG